MNKVHVKLFSYILGAQNQAATLFRENHFAYSLTVMMLNAFLLLPADGERLGRVSDHLSACLRDSLEERAGVSQHSSEMSHRQDSMM